jgi:hypothetical protein
MTTKDVMKNLKIGDNVAISGYYSMALGKVKKITPTGRIELENGHKYDNTGRLMGNHFHRSTIVSMEEYNTYMEKKEKENHKKDLIHKIVNRDFTYLSIDKLEKILKVIEEIDK